MIIIWFAGRCENGIATWGYVLHGLTVNDLELPPVSACGVVEGKNPTADVAAYHAIGRALGFLVSTAVPLSGIHFLGSAKNVIDQIIGKVQPGADLAALHKRCVELMKALPCKRQAEWIALAQNVEADNLARAAYVGKSGKLPAEREAGDDTKSKGGV